MLESLLLSTATAFLDFDARGEAMQVDGTSHSSSSLGSPGLSRSAASASSSSTAVPSSSSVGGACASAAAGAHSQADSAIVGGHIGATGSSSSKNRRRKMVADCKAMRVQVLSFHLNCS